MKLEPFAAICRTKPNGIKNEFGSIESNSNFAKLVIQFGSIGFEIPGKF